MSPCPASVAGALATVHYLGASPTITLHPNRIVYTTVGAPELVIALRQVEAVEAPLWPRSRNFVRIRTGGKVHDLFVRGKGPEVRDAISAALP